MFEFVVLLERLDWEPVVQPATCPEAIIAELELYGINDFIIELPDELPAQAHDEDCDCYGCNCGRYYRGEEWL
jgi:hypothetical protein